MSMLLLYDQIGIIHTIRYKLKVTMKVGRVPFDGDAHCGINDKY